MMPKECINYVVVVGPDRNVKRIEAAFYGKGNFSFDSIRATEVEKSDLAQNAFTFSTEATPRDFLFSASKNFDGAIIYHTYLMPEEGVGGHLVLKGGVVYSETRVHTGDRLENTLYLEFLENNEDIFGIGTYSLAPTELDDNDLQR